MDAKKYKLLIADDEYWAREKIINMLDWAKYALELLEPAVDGEDVLRKIEWNKPNILITDISMPYLNGVELLQIIEKKYPEVITLVISGYDDFEYVKNSFLHGSINYLMKPVSKMDMVAAITKALEIISKRENQRYEEIKKNSEVLKAASLMEDRELSQLLERKKVSINLNITINSQTDLVGSRLILIKIHDLSKFALELNYDMNFLSYSVKKKIRQYFIQKNVIVFNHIYRSNEFIILTELEINKVKNITKKLMLELATFLKSVITITISDHFYSMESIQQSYMQAVMLLMSRKFKKENELIIIGQEEKLTKTIIRVRDAQIKELEELFKRGNKLAAHSLIFDEIGIGHSGEEEWSYLEVKQTVRKILNCCIEFGAGRISVNRLISLESTATETADKIMELLDLEALEELLDEIMHTIMKAGVKEGDNTIRGIVKQAVSYIDTHYYENLTLTKLSKKYAVEKTYFSSMFTKEVSESLITYITKVRIKKAIEYMKQKNTSLTEIAFMIGYDDYTYFNKVFRKLMGVSPREYRSMMKEDKNFNSDFE